MFLSIMIFSGAPAPSRVVVSWLTAALSLRNVAFFPFATLQSHFCLFFQLRDCPLRQPRLIYNLNQLCSLLVHFMACSTLTSAFPWQPHHPSFVCFDVINPLQTL